MKHELIDEQATLHLGAELAGCLRDRFRHNACVYLRGDLGAGKTTLSRGILRALGFAGAVKSPTYTLLEPYELSTCLVLHLDLYRLARADELVFVGLDEALDQPAIKLIEWPERGEGYLPAPDIEVALSVEGDHRVAHVNIRECGS